MGVAHPDERAGVDHRVPHPLARIEQVTAPEASVQWTSRQSFVSTHRHLDPRACDLAVALLGVAVAEIEQGAAVVDREVDGIADAGLGCVHVAAVLGGCDRAACLERRRDAEAGQEGMQPDLR